MFLHSFTPSGRAKGKSCSINLRHISPSLPVLVPLQVIFSRESSWRSPVFDQLLTDSVKTAHFSKNYTAMNRSRRDNSKTASLCARESKAPKPDRVKAPPCPNYMYMQKCKTLTRGDAVLLRPLVLVVLCWGVFRGGRQRPSRGRLSKQRSKNPTATKVND